MIDFSARPPLVKREDFDDLNPFTDDQVAAACEDVRGACGWHIAPRSTETFYLDSDGGTLLTLPSLLITEPDVVADADGNPITDYTWSPIGQLERTAGWPRGFQAVTVTVDHGVTKVPASIVAVIVDMLTDRAAVTAGRGPVKSVALDGASIAYGGAETSGVQRDLMATYGHVLRRYAL